jgi:AcrR family transcriptional regulator
MDNMSTASRKQREIRERELRLLDVARGMLVRRGFAGLTMDDLAAATEYSKGVVYQHFKSKEDLVVALAVQSLKERKARFDRALQFEGRSRERMLAIGVAEELFVRLHPQHFHSEQVIKLAALHERASAERLEQLMIEERGCFANALSVVLEGIDRRDLVLPADVQPADVVFGLWSINFGCFTLLETDRAFLQSQGIASSFGTVRMCCHAMLDGFGWKPLSHEWDYEATQRRVMREVFAEECLSAGLG